ncbi:hypothetical protein CROQUDRAFT_652401 [Cronartium quercuum f. sp. fusiforme G11]|uniref:GATA-type domain-containing protein n=1 Tax=Cronartium quercuum f. sp. fusiforme G11 TaxID=708437 RepID=A0A9P6NW08_9BASI|nr:hypothetical protein CROQUDRAFT_652401 [Cronartium quercuum f. sp. fusiforme G11]
MVDPSVPHSSRYLSSFPPPVLQSRSLPGLQSQSQSHSQPASLSGSSSSSSAAHLHPRSTTPARFLGSGSPLPPTSSAYALASSARSLGTPTSDIRGTSPTAQPDPDHEIHLQAPSTSDWSLSTHSPTTPFDFTRPSAPSIVNCDARSQPYVPPPLIQSSPSTVYVNTPSPNPTRSRPSCFWAILDHELKFVYVDPTLQAGLGTESDAVLSTTLYHYIHPADIDAVMAVLDPEQVLFLPPSSTDNGPPTTANPHQRAPSGLILPSPTSTAVDRKTSSTQHRFIQSCRFARPSHLRRLLRHEEGYFVPEDSETGYAPVQVFLNPIGETHFLCFFHALPDTPATQLQSTDNVSSLPSWSTAPNPTAAAHSSCGVMDTNPGSFYFPPDQSLKLESSMVQSAQIRAENLSPTDSSSSPNNPHHRLDVFQILDSTTGAVLFSYPPSSGSALDGWKGRYRPEEFAYLAMNTKQSPESATEEPTHTACSTRYKAQHKLVKEGAVGPGLDSVVISYGSLTFASFRPGSSTLPPPPSQPTSYSPKPPPIKPPTMELIHDARPPSLEIYSPHPASFHPRVPKRPRTNSYTDVPTPQSATSVHSHQQPASYVHQSVPQHSNFAYPSHPGSAQLSPMVPNLGTIPDSPEPYASAYAHFSGEPSPTMASAANVLGSFHRAHYAHPQSMLAFADVHRSRNEAHPLSPFDNTGFNLQGLAQMAVGGHYDTTHRPPQDFSPSSASSSPRPNEQQPSSSAFGLAALTPTTPTYRRTHAHSASVDLAAHHLLGIGQASSSIGLAPEPNYSHHAPAPPSPGKAQARMGCDPTSGTQVPRACTSCGVQNSPEWRKGPNGVKSLCNACGLRFSRAQARKSKVGKAAGGSKKAIASGQLSKPQQQNQPKKPRADDNVQQQQQQQQQHQTREFYQPSTPEIGFGAVI